MVRFSARVQERCKLENGPFSYYHVKWTAPISKLLLETWLGLKKKKKMKKKHRKKKEASQKDFCKYFAKNLSSSNSCLLTEPLAAWGGGL